MIIPGIKISDGAIVSVYSVVTKDAESCGIVGGNLTRFVKKRCTLLQEFKWWDFDADSLQEVLTPLVNPDLGNVRLQIEAILSVRKVG